MSTFRRRRPAATELWHDRRHAAFLPNTHKRGGVRAAGSADAGGASADILWALPATVNRPENVEQDFISVQRFAAARPPRFSLKSARYNHRRDHKSPLARMSTSSVDKRRRGPKPCCEVFVQCLGKTQRATHHLQLLNGNTCHLAACQSDEAASAPGHPVCNCDFCHYKQQGDYLRECGCVQAFTLTWCAGARLLMLTGSHACLAAQAAYSLRTC